MSVVSGSKVVVDGAVKQTITLGTLLKSGGAGSVYQICENTSQVAKIYHCDQPLPVYERKVKAMLSLSPNLPDIADAGGSFVQIAWPQAILRDQHGGFLGFVMPSLDIKATSELEYILQERQARAEGLPTGLGVKITLAANLSAVIAELHRQHHYVVDMKPVNLRFYRRSLYMAMLDCDGFSIKGQDERFEAPQFTPEYLAPEFHVNGITVEGEEQQDRFALAVVIFQLLNFGIHPFTGRPSSEQVPTDIPGRIRTRNYAYGLRSSNAISPSIISGHETISKQLRYLFDRAFESPGNTRPSAGEWASTLKLYAQKLSGSLLVCQKNKEHQFFSGYTCAACNRENILKKARQMATSKPATRAESPLGKPRAWQRAAALAKKLPSIAPRKRKTSRPAFTKMASYIQAQANAKQARSTAARYYVPPSPPQSAAAPISAHSINRRNWLYLHVYPSLIIACILIFSGLLTFLKLNSGSSSDSSYDSSNSSTEESWGNGKQLESNAEREKREFNEQHPYLPAPDVLATNTNILLGANAVSSGNAETFQAAFESLRNSAAKQREPYPTSLDRYREANRNFLGLNAEGLQGFEKRQSELEYQLSEILKRDPLVAQAALDMGWYRISQVDQKETWFQQVILAKPEMPSAWYGLGIQMMGVESEETVVGIFAIAELLYGNTVADEDSRTRGNTLVRTFPAEKQKQFAILKIRAQQLAAEMLSKGVVIRMPDATAEPTETIK